MWVGLIEKKKKEVIRKAEELDKKSESIPLSQKEIDLKHSLKERLCCLERKKYTGTKSPKQPVCFKVTETQNISTRYQMKNTEKQGFFILIKRMG